MKAVLLSLVFFGGCTSFYQHDNELEQKRMLISKRCCSQFDRNGHCLAELIPGCVSNSAGRFKESFLVEDKCCELWGADGLCYKERVKDCSRVEN